MTVRNTLIGGTDYVTPQDRIKPTDLNDTFNEFANYVFAGKIQQIYTAAGLDNSISGSNQSATATVEMNAISAVNIGNADYVKIEVNALAYVLGDNQNATINIKIEAKEVGGSYSDSLATSVFLEALTSDTSGINSETKSNQSFNHYHTLTTGEKSNGVQFQITISMATGADTTNEASFTNRQIVIKNQY